MYINEPIEVLLHSPLLLDLRISYYVETYAMAVMNYSAAKYLEKRVNSDKSRLRNLWFSRFKRKLYCVICGKSEPEVPIEFHHIFPLAKLYSISTLVRSKDIRPLLEELRKCVPLCKNHHYKIEHDKEESLEELMTKIKEYDAENNTDNRVFGLDTDDIIDDYEQDVDIFPFLYVILYSKILEDNNFIKYHYKYTQVSKVDEEHWKYMIDRTFLHDFFRRQLPHYS